MTQFLSAGEGTTLIFKHTALHHHLPLVITLLLLLILNKLQELVEP